MRLHVRLILLIGLSTLIPLGVTGFAASQIASQAQVAQAQALHRRQATGLATFVATWLEDRVRGLALSVSLWDVSALDDAKLQGLQSLLYGQFEAVNVVSVVDAEGATLVPPLALKDPAKAGRPAHEPVSAARLAAFNDHLPITEALAEGVAIGLPYRPPDTAHRVLPIGVAAPAGDVVVGAELSLAEVAQAFLSPPDQTGTAVLVDSRGEVIAGDPAGLVEPGLTRSFVGQVEGELSYTSPAGAAHAAFASLGDVGWTVIVAVPAATVEEPADEIRRRTAFMYLLALVLAAAMGMVGAAQIARPVVLLKEAARRVGEGQLGRTVEPEGSDEIIELMHAFNQMSRRLADNQATIDARNAEIKAWNEELLERVEAGTQELRESQSRLVHTARAAAVAEMGAGLAHSLNNPVAGILGMVQVIRARGRAPELDGMLQAVEGQAQRCREILAGLNRFSDRGVVGERVPVELQALLGDVLSLVGGAFEESGQSIEREGVAVLPTSGDPALLGQALAQLLRSLRSALGLGGTLRIQGEVVGDMVALAFTLSADSGAGGDDWLASGMGFWLARQVFEEHGGRLEEPAEGSVPAVYRVYLPLHPAPTG
ncbi:MAG: HAMP domain-containing histidine kinase [Alphaproteobacteria bacterium]|nr:HAMP domain-containing histidine kinase [Alphaproteobacteria bacterium]